MVGKRGLAEGKVENQHRKTGRGATFAMALTEAIAFTQRNTKVWGSRPTCSASCSPDERRVFRQRLQGRAAFGMSRRRFAGVRGVLFDLDGTLLDTERLILVSFRHAVETVLGKEHPDERLMAKVGQPLTVQM